MLRKILKYYAWAHKTKTAQSLRSVNLAWRVSVIILVALAIFLVYDYLQGKYPDAVTYTPLAEGALPQVFILGEKLFTWFLIGVFFGIIAVSVINEGEYFLAVRRIALDVEREAERAVKELGKEAGREARLLAPPVFEKGGRKRFKKKKKVKQENV